MARAGPTFRCQICLNPEIASINMELMQGYSVLAVATSYGLSSRSLRRHWHDHVIQGGEGDGQGVMLITLRDVMDIPLQMRERKQVIAALIEKCLEPLSKRASKNSPGGLNAVPMAFLLGLFKIQQTDEQTLLKVTGILKDGVTDVGAGALLTEQYQHIQEAIEGRLAEVSGGDSQLASEARLLLAEMLAPMEEIEAEYRDLGRTSKNGSSPH